MKLRIKANLRKAEGETISPSGVSALKEAFEDGTVAEALDFILDRYLDLNDLYPICQKMAETPHLWESVTVKALTIEIFYILIKEIATLNVNNDIDLSVTYWVNQALPIMEKVLADSTELRS
jgi:hypothetical protein